MSDKATNRPVPVVKQDNSEINAIFIHSAVDDAGLSQAAFRVICHLSRRAGKGSAYPSAKSMASTCNMKRDTVFRALSELKERGMLEVETRAGGTSVYRITAPSEWTRPE